MSEKHEKEFDSKADIVNKDTSHQGEESKIDNKDDNDSEDEVKEIEVYVKDPEERSSFFESRIEKSNTRKEEGNQLFKDKNYENALLIYRYGLYHCFFDEMSYNFELLDDHRTQVDKIKLPLLLNSLQCILKDFKKENTKLAFEIAEQALKIDSNNSKALYRRAQVYIKIDNEEKAKIDLINAAKNDPSSREVRTLLQDTIGKLKSLQKKADVGWKSALKKDFESTIKPSSSTNVSKEIQQGICSRISKFIFGDNKTKTA